MIILTNAAAMLLSQGTAAPPPKQIIQPVKCDAGKAQALVKRAADTSVLAEAIRLSGSYNLRVLWPGDRLDADDTGTRLTIEVDSNNKITRLRCG